MYNVQCVLSAVTVSSLCSESSWCLLHLCVVQLEEGVVVVGVVVHPLVQHRHVAVDLLAALVQRPVLTTLPATALLGPAAHTQC